MSFECSKEQENKTSLRYQDNGSITQLRQWKENIIVFVLEINSWSKVTRVYIS